MVLRNQTNVMKRLPTLLSLWILSSLAAWGASPGWLASYDKALEFSKKSGRPVLINFTGSDWCGWCKKMKAETLAKPEFIQFASSNLILVELDFPQGIPQTQEIKAANAAVKNNFKVGGFPTFVLVDSKGAELGRQRGYLAGGVPAFTAQLKNWIATSRAEAAAKP